MRFRLPFVLAFATLFASFPEIKAQPVSWIFGQRAGIRFNTNGTTTPFTVSPSLSSSEGCAVYNDASGLRFFSDGITLRNRNNQVCPNGSGLFGDSSSTQSAVFAEYPGDTTKLILFVVDGWGNVGNPVQPGETCKGLSYSIINKTLNNGLGDIVPGQKNIILLQPTQEKVAIQPKSDCSGYWVITMGTDQQSDKFYAYCVDANGVSSTPVVSEGGYLHYNPIGEMEISPDGKYLAYTTFLNNYTALFDFDAATGVVSNGRQVTYAGSGDGNPYGIEFSDNSQYLYVSTLYFGNSLFRYDLPGFNNAQTIATEPGEGYKYGMLSKGPDGKIYMARVNQPFISAIENPNSPNPTWVNQAVLLSPNTYCRAGLPTSYKPLGQINASIRKTIGPVCQLPVSVSFAANGTNLSNSQWTFGNGQSSTALNATTQYNNYGVYPVRFQSTSASGCVFSAKDTVRIAAPEIPDNPFEVRLVKACTDSFLVSFQVSDSTAFSRIGWTVNGQAISTAPRFTRYFFAPGQLTISLTGTTVQDSCFFTFPDTILLLINPAPPVILQDSIPGTCSIPTRIQYQVADSIRFLQFRWSSSLGNTGGAPRFEVSALGGNVNTVVQLLSRTGCTFTREIDKLIAPVSQINTGSIQPAQKPLATGCGTFRHVLSFTPQPDFTYAWDFGASYPILITRQQSEVQVPFTESGTYPYTVKITNAKGCDTVLALSISIPEFLIPNLITPNGDGKNDMLELPYPDLIEKLEVFNRWGKPVFTSQAYQNNWSAGEVAPGVYFYKIQYQGATTTCTNWLMVYKD